MSGLSRFVEDALLDWYGGTPMPDPPAALYVTTYLVMPADDGTGGTEQTAAGFSRQPFTLGPKFTDADGARTRAASATATLGPNASGAPVGPLVGFGVWSVPSGGTSAQFLGSDLFRDGSGNPVTKTVQPGDRLDIPADAIDQTLSKLKIKIS
ncbi:MAG TPA: hypothetical protein VFS43_38355 [Polyangiaceae bacterium]|nr:hypothetical protein [Polyangiaceae bacterium]